MSQESMEARIRAKLAEKAAVGRQIAVEQAALQEADRRKRIAYETSIAAVATSVKQDAITTAQFLKAQGVPLYVIDERTGFWRLSMSEKTTTDITPAQYSSRYDSPEVIETNYYATGIALTSEGRLHNYNFKVFSSKEAQQLRIGRAPVSECVRIMSFHPLSDAEIFDLGGIPQEPSAVTAFREQKHIADWQELLASTTVNGLNEIA